MNGIDQNRRLWRGGLLAVTLVSFAGPWAFDVIHVPAQFACSPPFARLEGDFCGQPMAGFQIFLWLAGGLASISGRLANEGVAAGDFLVVLIFLIPFATVVMALVMLLRRGRGAWWLLAAWLVGAGSTGFMLYRMGATRVGHVWGLWLFVIAALAAAVVEALALAASRRSTSGLRSD